MQASVKLNEISFDSLEKKFVEREKDFGKKTTPQSSDEVVCLARKEKNHAHDSSRGRGGRRGRGRKNNRGGWADITKEKYLTFFAYNATKNNMILPHVSSHGIGLDKKGRKRKEKHQIK